MGKVLNPSMRLLQGEADEYVMLNHSKEVFEHYQSLVKGSERISTGILSMEESTAQKVALMKKQAGAIANEARGGRAQISSIVKAAGNETAEKVVQEGGKGMARRTLGGILEAGEVAAKVMRFRV